MRPEQQIQRAPRAVRHAGVMTGEATQLDAIAARLMAVQRHWNDPDRALHLADALAAGALSLPADVQHNLLILSVYADHKIAACESAPSADALGSLIALTHALAGSLSQWREAA
jgi:hypothetical protein